jgi:hypothetical protein
MGTLDMAVLAMVMGAGDIILLIYEGLGIYKGASLLFCNVMFLHRRFSAV